MNTEELIRLFIKEQAEIIKVFPVSQVGLVCDRLIQAYEDGSTIYACGNGGNAAYVSNLLTDLSMHPFVSEDKHKVLSYGTKRLRTVHLVDSGSTLTAILNDLGPDNIFRQQLINDGVKKNDIVFGFSGSGNSKNIVEAFDLAKQQQAITIAITRGNGGKLKEIADYCIIIPGSSTFPGQTGGNDNNFHYEDCLSSISHMMTGILRKYVKEKYQSN
jgi:D-sedoheptulose 7-phosphate isomerase